jgi:hypothetical protein
MLSVKRANSPRDTFSYHADKRLWSITPDFPDNSLHGLNVKSVRISDRFPVAD